MPWILQIEEMDTNFIGSGFLIGGPINDQLNKVLAIIFSIGNGKMIFSWFLGMNMSSLNALLYPRSAGGNMGR